MTANLYCFKGTSLFEFLRNGIRFEVCIWTNVTLKIVKKLKKIIRGRQVK